MPMTLLQGEGRMQIGNCQVELASREMSGPQSSRLRRLTPKSLAVLRHLAAARGQVLSREYLLAQVWADSDPTDDVLTQAITQLRKAFAALDASQPYIETIARSGYRLLVDVRVLPAALGEEVDTAADSGAGSVTGTLPDTGVALVLPRNRARQRHRRRVVVFAVMAVLLMCCIAALVTVLLTRPGAGDTVPGAGVPADVARPYRLLTATQTPETDPALSPDGRQVAYVRLLPGDASEVVVQDVGPNSRPQVLDVPPAGARDRWPVWSPDGQRIAFARRLADGRCAVLLATVGQSQPPVSLMRCDRTEALSFDFSPDGQALLVGSSQDTPGDGAIARLQIDTREWTVLDYARQPGDLDHSPRLSPDGRWLVFIRNPQMGQLWRMPAGGGQPQPLGNTVGEIDGFAWLPDSRHVVVTRWVGMERRLFRVDVLADAAWPGQDLGIDQATLPAVSRNVPLLAFVQHRLDSHLVRVSAGNVLSPLGEGSGEALLPSVSADGRQVAFVSNRSGVPAVWLSPVSGSAPAVMVPGLQPGTHQPAAWAPDGQRLLVVGFDDNGMRRLYEIDPQTQGVVAMVVPGAEPLQAAYTDDPSRLLVVQAVDGRPQLVLYDRTRSPWSVLGRVGDVTQVRWQAASPQVLFTRIDRPGLFGLPADLAGEPVLLSALRPERRDYRSWSVSGQGVLWMAHGMPGCALFLQRGAVGGPLSGRCLPQERPSLGSGFAGVSGDGPVLSLGHNQGGEIGVMPLPGTASGQLPDSVKLLISK